MPLDNVLLIIKGTGTFVVVAGDTFHGQSFATMSEGKSIAELMDTFYADGYDATTPGNHDWSYGADKLRTMTGTSVTGTLAATGDRTLAMVGACLIGGIVIIVLGIIWKRRR